MLKNILQTLKINHYIKNLIIAIPLFFSMNYANVYLYKICIEMFISFCLISSAVYIFNDLADIEKDSKHPVKSKRPIASGKISKRAAIIMFFILFIAGIYAACRVNILCTVMVGLYLILNVLYSILLKSFVLIDIACIALGFILRIVAGCFAIYVLPSPFVILMTFFGSMFFTFTKRKLELLMLGKENCRTSINGLDVELISQFIFASAILCIAFYFTYTIDIVTINRAGTQYLYITTIPLTLIMFRLLCLTNSSYTGYDPIVFLKDKILIYFAIFYIFTFILAYLLK